MRLPHGGTALAGALLLQSPQAWALDVVLGGSLGFEVIGATKNRLNGSFDKRGDDGRSDRGYQFSTDAEMVVRAEGETDAGLLYGAEITLEGDVTTTAKADSVFLFFSGGFGRVELGASAGAEDNMRLAADTIAAGTGGIDGDLDTALGTEFAVTDSGDAVKASYYTPRIAGFQAGVSFTPDTDDFGDNEVLSGNQNGEFENQVGFGLNFLDELDFGDLGLALVGSFGRAEDVRDEETGLLESGDDDLASLGFGGLVGFGDLQLAGSYVRAFEVGEGNLLSAGIAYAFGEVNLSLTYNGVFLDDDDEPDDATRDVVVLSADTGLMPGVTLAADLGLALYDKRTGPEPDSPDGSGQTIQSGDVLAGIVKLNLEF